MSLVEAVLVWQGGTGVGEHRQVHIHRQVQRQRQTEILTVSMFCMMSWKVGWFLKEAESMLTGIGEHRQTGMQIGSDRQVQRQTGTHRGM